MSKFLPKIIVLCLMGSSLLWAEETMTQQLRFTEESREYFAEELALPVETSEGERARIDKSDKVAVVACPGEGGSWELTFTFPKEVKFKRTQKQHSLILDINQGVDSSDYLKVHQQLSYLLDRFSNGYHTLYLVAKRAVYYSVEANGKVLTINIVPNLALPMSATERLRIARARWLVESRKYVPALRSLYALANEYPCSKDTAVLIASQASLLPNWQEGVHALTYMREQYPEDNDIQSLLHDAFFPHSSFLRYQRQLQRTIGLANEQYNLLQAELITYADLCHVFYLGTALEMARGHIRSVINSEGNIAGFIGTRYREHFYFRDEFVSGSTFRASLYTSRGLIGLGAEASTLLIPLQTELALIADWHRPYWEIFETFEFDGREDRLKFRLSTKVKRRWEGFFEGGARRLGTKQISTGIVSLLAGGEVFWNWWITNPLFAIRYGLDAEYVLFEKEKVDSAGTAFKPLPLVSRENHTIGPYLYYLWRDRVELIAAVGETFNRLGTHDISWRFSAKYIKPCCGGWEFEISAIQYPSTSVQGATGQFFTGTFTLRF